MGLASFGGSESAQLIGQAVYNNYSYIQPGLPNYGIAQGSIFIMAGSNNMTDSTASQSVPLQTSLAGVTITVTVGDVTTQAIPYFVSPSQITAILPSKTPVGKATVTVTSRGKSVSSSTIVVPSAFGMATIPPPAGGSGVVAAVAQNNNEGGQLLSRTNAANPGEYLTFWGSGLGPVPGDETQYQNLTNLTAISAQVDIGGVSATVTYHGRSSYPGLDQINVIVPAGVSGCNVSVVVSVGGVPSNIATIPVAPSGRICSDPGLIPVTTDEFQVLDGRASVNMGAISLTTLTTTDPAAIAVTSDSAYAVFQRYTAEQFAYDALLQLPSLGSCLVVNGVWRPPLNMETTGTSQLNAGPQINLKGPMGSLALLSASGTLGGAYLQDFGTSPAIIPSAGGTFSFDNGSGGPDVKSFSASLNANVTSPLLWTNRSTIQAVDRAKGQLITWTGGSPGTYVNIFGYSIVYQPAPTAAGEFAEHVYFTCSAPVSAGQFVVPAAVLEGLPPTGTSVGLDPSGNGYLYVTSGGIQRFTASGLDFGLLYFSAGGGISVPFN